MINETGQIGGGHGRDMSLRFCACEPEKIILRNFVKNHEKSRKSLTCGNIKKYSLRKLLRVIFSSLRRCGHVGTTLRPYPHKIYLGHDQRSCVINSVDLTRGEDCKRTGKKILIDVCSCVGLVSATVVSMTQHRRTPYASLQVTDAARETLRQAVVELTSPAGRRLTNSDVLVAVVQVAQAHQDELLRVLGATA